MEVHRWRPSRTCTGTWTTGTSSFPEDGTAGSPSLPADGSPQSHRSGLGGALWGSGGDRRKQRIPQSSRCAATARAAGIRRSWSPGSLRRGQRCSALRRAIRMSNSRSSGCTGRSPNVGRRVMGRHLPRNPCLRGPDSRSFHRIPMMNGRNATAVGTLGRRICRAGGGGTGSAATGRCRAHSPLDDVRNYLNSSTRFLFAAAQAVFVAATESMMVVAVAEASTSGDGTAATLAAPVS